MAAPFLDIDGFKAEYQGSLAAGEVTTATRLLEVVSDGIRGLKPDVGTLAAQQVVFEVVRDSIMYGDVSLLSSFQNITSRRQEAGTFDASAKAVEDMLTGRQRRMLGLSVTAAPLFNFPDCDY